MSISSGFTTCMPGTWCLTYSHIPKIHGDGNPQTCCSSHKTLQTYNKVQRAKYIKGFQSLMAYSSETSRDSNISNPYGSKKMIWLLSLKQHLHRHQCLWSQTQELAVSTAIFNSWIVKGVKELHIGKFNFHEDWYVHCTWLNTGASTVSRDLCIWASRLKNCKLSFSFALFICYIWSYKSVA